MPRTSTVHAVTTIGMDMGKNTLHMIGLDKRGAIVLREKVSRGRITSRLANLPPGVLADGGMTIFRAADLDEAIKIDDFIDRVAAEMFVRDRP